MIAFYSISTFRQHLETLTKVKRNVYIGILTEISKEFSDKTIEQIRQNRDMILIEEDGIVIKLRLPDKRQRLSKSDGYRLIYLVSNEVEVVVFLDVYPKNGPLQKLNFTELELKSALQEFISEASANALVPYEI